MPATSCASARDARTLAMRPRMTAQAGRAGSSRRRVRILARSARSLAAAARAAGWEAVVIDQFGDTDTRALALASSTVPADADFAFDRRATLAALAQSVRTHGALPLVLGPGFEDAAALVATIEQRHRVLGCAASTLAALADRPAALARLDARAPATLSRPPRYPRGWLAKQKGACGGLHVAAATEVAGDDDSRYFQRALHGRSLSFLYLATSRDCTVCAVFDHLRWHRAPAQRYRYEGALCVPAPGAALLAEGAAAGQAVARTFALRGCFGIDFVRHEAGALYVVDINPRPPITLDLLADRGRVFDAHLAACARDVLTYRRPARRPLCAQLLLYAERAWRVPATLRWPGWVSDRSPPGTLIEPGAPLCTLHAVAATPDAVLSLLATRYAALRAILGAAAVTPLPPSIAIRFMEVP